MNTTLPSIPKGNRRVIAIDGPAGAGKGAICRAVAAQFDLTYLETGALYRVLALLSLQSGIHDPQLLADMAITMPFVFRSSSADPSATVWYAFLNGKNITDQLRQELVGQTASQIAAIPAVRTALLSFQRHYGAGKNIILDGRDVGTMVWPDADLKIYLTASLEERAKRRALELQERGEDVNLPEIHASMAERDKRDTERTHAPLKPASDAILVDTTEMSLLQSIQVVASLVEATVQR